MNKPLLTIVVPCYNEEAVLADTFRELKAALQALIDERLVAPESKLLFVDDGSSDRTWALISERNRTDPMITGLKLARNAGHQKALLAGLETAARLSDCLITIDADLQDDVGVMRDFILKFHEGFDIVYGVRSCRRSDTWFKRNSARLFYRFMNAIGIRLIPDHADYRLMSRRAVLELARYGESHVFLRGLVPLIGFSSTIVYYERKCRRAGQSKYNLRKMLSFAVNGIASFSVAPIRFVTFLGFALLAVSAVAGAYALIQKWRGNADAGWTSLMLSIWFLGGLQLLGIGVIGEYIGKIFVEVKRRPKYAVDVDLFSKQARQVSP